MASKTLLFVDDDRVVRQLIHKRCQRNDYPFDLVLAENGVEAVKMLQTVPISLVVTDLQMPEMDGFELLAYLSEHYPDIPVIIQTAHDSRQHRRAVLEGGAVGYVEKPLDVDALVTKIMDALDDTIEGGTLQSVPLETFCQLIEMEEKTCTLRIGNREDSRQGALFFNGGRLVEARYAEMRGKEAAAEILSWEHTTFSIQDTCQVESCGNDLGLKSFTLP
jgi:CheY-like chemotaxis protein